VSDPHVEALRYKLVVLRDGVTYREGLPPVERDLDGFSIRLSHDVLTVTMHDHYATRFDAMKAVEPYLHAWRADATLAASGPPEFDFEYQDVTVIDRDPPDGSPGSVDQTGAGAIAVAVALSGKVAIEHGSYPEPPDHFALDENTETLWNRWQAYVEGSEPLQGMAHACLTMLEMYAGRLGASAWFNVSGKVLGTLGRLSTEPGDPLTVRKMTPKMRPLEPQERAWLEAAVKALVRRAGEIATGVEGLPEITMANLPEL
jgi:hypothetical protein